MTTSNQGADDKAEGSSWRQAHEGLLRLAARRAGLDFEEGQRLRAALLAGVHVRLGYGSFVEYIERLFGYSPRLTYEKLRVAEALEALPGLTAALRQAALSWSVVRELTRVATPETEPEWQVAAQSLTARQVQELVSGHRPGSRPTEPRDESALRHVLRFEVSGEAFAAFREAIAKIRRDAGGPLDDDAALLLLARQALGGPRDDGRASYQLALTVCERCRHVTQDARGQVVPVSPELLAMAECDGQHLGNAHVGVAATGFHMGQVDVSAHVGTSRDDAYDVAYDDAYVEEAGELGETGVSAELADGVAPVGESRGARPSEPHRPRAKQTIPPVVRRLVLRRDRHRCVFPGCQHATFVDVHHVRSRADQGQHRPENLATLCGAHHRAVHRGDVVVDGQAPAALRFRHADGTPYSAPVAPLAAEIQGQAFRALRGMGFGETEVRRALSDPEQRANDPTSLESVLRRALRSLTERRVTRAA